VISTMSPAPSTTARPAHPHVFGESPRPHVAVRAERWSDQTEQEAGAVSSTTSPRPSRTAPRPQGAAARGGRRYDWPDLDGPAAKVREELDELLVELERAGRPALETEPDRRWRPSSGSPLHRGQSRAVRERRSRARAPCDDESLPRARRARRAARCRGRGGLDGARPRGSGALVRAGGRPSSAPPRTTRFSRRGGSRGAATVGARGPAQGLVSPA